VLLNYELARRGCGSRLARWLRRLMEIPFPFILSKAHSQLAIGRPFTAEATVSSRVFSFSCLAAEPSSLQRAS
jgi:hypothetical protein